MIRPVPCGGARGSLTPPPSGSLTSQPTQSGGRADLTAASCGPTRPWPTTIVPRRPSSSPASNPHRPRPTQRIPADARPAFFSTSAKVPGADARRPTLVSSCQRWGRARRDRPKHRWALTGAGRCWHLGGRKRASWRQAAPSTARSWPGAGWVCSGYAAWCRLGPSRGFRPHSPRRAFRLTAR